MKKLHSKKEALTVYVIKDHETAMNILARCEHEDIVALDFETTALRPTDSKDARVRITSISFQPDIAYVIDHDYAGAFEDMADAIALAAPQYYVFNSKFEYTWFDYDTKPENEVVLFDVSHMRRSVLGGGPLSLKTQAKWDLKVDLVKDEQNSDWGNPHLTSSQYFYAGKDAAITMRLAQKWAEEMTPEQWNGFHVINDATRAVVEMEETGMLVESIYHRSLIDMWERRRDASEKAIRRIIGDQIKNLNSPKQVSDFLKSLLSQQAVASWPTTDSGKDLSLKRDVLRMMSYVAPYPLSRLLSAFMVRTRANKYISTYGDTLLTKQKLSPDGRLHGRLNIAQAITGRFSSSGPNLQNIPRSPVVRKSFIAGLGKKMCLADYSGVEIRVLAELSGDEQLLHDCIYGDVHSESAIVIYQVEDAEGFKKGIKDKKNPNPQFKEMRSRAKGFTFQLLYGAGAAALSIVLRCTVDEAAEYIVRWAARYPKAYHYRQIMFERMMHDGTLPCASGRTIFVKRPDRSMPVASNYPIQGSAGDVMYAACTRVHDILREEDWKRDEISMMVTVHDEMLLLCDEKHAEDAKEILAEGMIAGWLDIFPGSNTDNLVDAVIGDSWGDKA